MGEADVRANVEDADLDRRNLGLDALEQGDHLIFLAGIRAHRMGDAALGADGGGQRLKLIGMATDDHRLIPLASEPLGDRSAQGVAGANDDDGLAG